MQAEPFGIKRQEIDLVKRNSAGVITQHKKVILENGVKKEIEMEV